MHFPLPYDAHAADRLLQAFPGPLDGKLTPLLACLGGNSPYLSDLALREPGTVRAIATQGPDAVCDRALSGLTNVPPGLPRAQVAALLRGAKRQVALASSIADIGGIWELDQITGALSDLADAALQVATAHVLRSAHDAGELRLPHPAAPPRGSGFTVLAMGKLGGRELNFSSDVDLILIFDPAAHAYNAEGLGAIFARLTRDLAGLMQARDANGYVFRTDLRLRPDPGSTAPAISLDSALAYYEGAAQTWERAALIKARPVAGDLALGRRFLEAIRPFVWRRHLDFAAIADIRAMKARMDGPNGLLPAAGTEAAPAVLGHDLKLGKGGIREVEFCAQTLQLVWGGRNPALRTPRTLDALRAEAAAGYLPGGVADELADAYSFLRRAEHRLQMVADRQTHSLPATLDGLAGFARFLGADDTERFAAALMGHLTRVHAAFASLLAKPATPPDLPRPDWRRDTVMSAAGAPGPSQSLPWEAWLAGRPRALRTERARALLRELLPAINAAIERQTDPDTVWARLDELIHRLPAGVQIFSMLRHNPALLERLADMLGAAPSLADHLANVPAALEGLVAPQEIDPDPSASLAAQLQDGRGLDEALGIASRFVRGEEFRLSVAELDGRIDQDVAGLNRSALADAAIGRILPLVMAEHARRYGGPLGGGLVVVALGKAGGQEMMAGSDLDLMLIYDESQETGAGGTRHGSGTGARLAPSQYYGRAAQALVAALTVPTRDGKLYEVDMRLRPSGGKGPVAVSLASFERYHRENAWTWERLALTRARLVAGPHRLRRRVASAIRVALMQGEPAGILPDTVAMRRRIAAELPPRGIWDVKLREGGLLELEFIAQALQLRHASHRRVPHPATRQAFANLARAGLLEDAEASRLIGADRVWRAVQGLLRITLGRAIPETLPAPVEPRMHRVLDHLTGPARGRTVAGRLDGVAHDVRDAFVRHVGEI
jgi:glutamate-ammonia-ligase adenylyltransferase